MINESLIIAVATVLFVGMVFKPAKKFLIGMLDEHTKEAVKNLYEAENIYKQAKKMLAEIKAEHAEAMATSASIAEKAKEEAEMLISGAHREIERITQKKSELAMARIIQQEQQIMDYLKDAIVSESIQKVHEFIAKEIDINTHLALVQEDVKQLVKKPIN